MGSDENNQKYRLAIYNAGNFEYIAKNTAYARFAWVAQSNRDAHAHDSLDQTVVEDCFRKATLTEGLPHRVYFDNGKQYCTLHKEIEIMKGVHGLLPVVIDLLDREMLEEIRFLLNFKMDSQSPMALILAGQTELWEKLKLQFYAAIRQRIDIQCAVGHMDRLQYIKTHLTFAGCDKDIFSDTAIDDLTFPAAYPALSTRLVETVSSTALKTGNPSSTTAWLSWLHRRICC